MTDTWQWLVARDYHGVRAHIILPLAREYQLQDFLERYSNHEVFNRPAGFHWDGGKLTKDERAAYERKPYTKL